MKKTLLIIKNLLNYFLRKCNIGSLTGAVAFYKVTKVYKVK